MYAKPYLVASVKDATGKMLLANKPAPKRVLGEGIAAMANDVLQGVVSRGTGIKAAQPRPVAGKTGTSTGYADAWFVGYTPNFAAAVWVGVPKGEVPMIPENGFRTIVAGGTFPALIWGRFAGSALIALPNAPFVTPAGAMVSVSMDRHRGCRANRWTPPSHVVVKSYLGGQEPKEVCKDPTGPAATVVPALLGNDVEYATRTLGHAGFLVKTVKVWSRTYPVNAVVSQSPPVGAAVEPGATVTLGLATTDPVPVEVPSVLGLDAASAERALYAAGLEIEVVIEPSCTGGAACQERLARDAELVWRQDVGAGKRLPAGSTVKVAVGPRQG
jgi:membrane peptidoglycan carboxypeptidase